MNRIATAGNIVMFLGQKFGHMWLSRAWRVIVAAICLLATAKPVAAITFNLNFVAGAINPNDPTGSGLMSIMQEAANRWTDIIEDSHTMTIDVSYATSCPVGGIACAGVVLPNVTLNRTVLGTIKVDPTHNWYFDPTPGDDSEFDFTQTLHRDLTSSQKTAGYSGTNIEPLLEVGFGGADNGSDPNVAGKSDMLTAALHEIGHLLGVTGNLSAGFFETLDGDYDLPPSLLAGRTMAVKAIPGNEAHFVDLFPLMAPSAGAPRVLASAADVLAAAAVSGWSQIDYSQKVFRTGTAWETAANWMGNRVPGIQDHATLRHGGSVSITTNAGVAGLLVGNSSQLTVRGTLIANGDVAINGGVLTRDSTANFILSPFKTMMIENGGQATFSGDYNLSANATYNVAGADSTWTIGSEFRVGVAGAGTLLIEDGGAVSNFNGYVGYSAGVDGDVTVADVGSTWTNSSGLFVGYDGTGTLMIEGGAAVNSSSGFVGLFAGSDGKVTVTGFNPANFDGSTWTTSSLSVGGDVQPGGTGYLKVLQLGIVEVNGDVKVWENGAIDIESRGKFIANGNVTVSGGLLTRYANGHFSLGAGKTMTVENGGVATFVDSYSTASNATYNITGIDSRLDAVVDCTLSIINGATVNVSSGGLLFDTTAIQVGFSNGTDGTLNVVGRSGLIASTVSLTGSSKLIVGHSTSGTAAINIGTTSSGAIFTTGTGTTTINKTGTVTIGSASTSGTLNANGDVLIDGGVLDHNGGTFTLAAGKNLTAQNNGNFSFSGTYLITGGSTYTVQSGAHFSTTATTFGNGTLLVDGIGSTLAITAATQLGSSGLTGTLTVRNKATADFNSVLGLADGSTSHLSGGILNVQSGATITTANIRIAPNSTNGQTGTFTVGNGVSTSRVTQDANATLVVGGNPTTGPVPNSGALTIDSGGVFNSGTGTGTITINPTGTINIRGGGTLNANGNVAVNGGVLQVGSGSSVIVAAGKTMTLINAGTLKGSGNVTGNVVNSSGVASPGTSPGTLSINGNYTQNAAGQLLIELASTSSFDRLAITGSAALAGTLDVDLLGGFIPQPGTAFQIISSSGGVSGTFGSALLPALTGANWQLRYNPNSVLLQVALLGDYNFNGTVDAADYVVWRKSLGQSGTALAADGNPNGQIDSGDFNVWRSHFGQTVPGAGSGSAETSPSQTAVPEPATLVLLMFAAVGWCLRPGRAA